MAEALSSSQKYNGQVPLLIAVDCIIIGFQGGVLKLLLFKRKVAPLAGHWSLIGSFVRPEESLDRAAKRVLKESTGLGQVFMEQSHTYGEVKRDPGARVISVAYYALTKIDDSKLAQVQKHGANWFDIGKHPHLILDHELMLQDALQQLRNKAHKQPIGFELLPQSFTLPQLQVLYEAIYNRSLDKRNFRKKILAMGILEKLEEKDHSGSRKGAYLYRFVKEKYEELVVQGFSFEI
ncbi:MAG: NUDIX domain-containing protein [Bacteroidota bacterium]